MYGYIYLITNRVNGKIYVGQHKYDKMELDPSYHGSGKKLWNAYNKYGIDKFDTTLIDTADTLDELNQKEIFYIDTLDCRNPDVGYNIAEGGGSIALSGENHPLYGKHHTEESKQKMSENHADYTGENHPLYGKHHTEESKQKMSENHVDFSGENNPMYGKHQTEETKQKISEALKGKCTGENHPLYGKHLTEEHKQKISAHTDNKGKNNPCYGKKLMNDGIIQKYIPKDEVEMYLEQGWKLGKLHK